MTVPQGVWLVVWVVNVAAAMKTCMQCHLKEGTNDLYYWKPGWVATKFMGPVRWFVVRQVGKRTA